jgi:hypothetical protein
MKKLLSPLLVIVLVACSSGNKETGSQDSVVAYNDTIAAPVVTGTTPVELYEEQTSDTSQLEITFDETAGLVFDKQEAYYTVTITTKQYEASSDVTWYFDNNFSPIYFKEDWASEGNEGSTEFFIEGGNVLCAATLESGEEKKWCRTTGGLRMYDGGSGDLLTELLPSEYGKTVNEELSRYLDILKALLKEAEITQQDGDSYTLRIEKTVDVGIDVQESTEVTIPKKVYKELVLSP